MSESSMTANLLTTACDLLRTEVTPVLPGSLRYTAAMIVNAMAIAARELEHGPANRAEVRALLVRLYPEAPDAASLDDLQRRLAHDLRAGRFDQDPDGCLRALLRGRTRLRLKISAPNLYERVRTP